MAELLVSHGANLNAKTYMEETPIGTNSYDIPDQPENSHDS